MSTTSRSGEGPFFHPTPAPRDDDVARVTAAVFRRVERKLADREPGARQRRFVESAPLWTAMADASARGVVATGPRVINGSVLQNFVVGTSTPANNGASAEPFKILGWTEL